MPHLAFSPPGWRGGDLLFVTASCGYACGLLPATLDEWDAAGDLVGRIRYENEYENDLVGYGAVDPSGDFGGDLFFTRDSFPVESLYRQDAAGTVSQFAPTLGVPRFGPGMPWGNGLYVADQVFAPDGTSTPFPGGFGRSLDWAFGDRFDGDMFVASGGSVKADIYRVKPDGSRTLFATGADPTFAYCNGSLWFAGPDGCWVVTPSKGNPAK